MALLGSLGSVLGLGSAQEFVQEVTGSPIAGRAAGVVSRGVSGLGNQQQGQATAIDVASTPPRETAMSGELGMQAGRATYGAGFQPAVQRMSGQSPVGGSVQNAFVGAVTPFAAPAAGTIGRFLFGLGAGVAAPEIFDALTGQTKKLRVTKKLKRDVKAAVNLIGVEEVANQMGVSTDVVIYVLTKKIRNDGPYVTKAAVRKTRSTVRKMKSMCDMYDDLRPKAKRSPARKASSRTTLIKN